MCRLEVTKIIWNKLSACRNCNPPPRVAHYRQWIDFDIT